MKGQSKYFGFAVAALSFVVWESPALAGPVAGAAAVSGIGAGAVAATVAGTIFAAEVFTAFIANAGRTLVLKTTGKMLQRSKRP